jgi:large subunit ribosomal protein L19
LAVTISDPFAPGKVSKFVGICIAREGQGLRATFTLRNVIEHEGVEIRYDLYNPTIRSIELLKLEKRLDDHLYYLRDAPLHYSEVPFDLEAEVLPENSEIPVNETRVKLNPHPWTINWQTHFHYLRGIEGLEAVPQDRFERAQKHLNRYEKYDLMKRYRENVPEEDQVPIWKEIQLESEALEEKRKEERRLRYLKKDTKL